MATRMNRRGSRVRLEHRAKVLGRLRADGPLSRADLAGQLGLSAQAVGEITAELESEGVVQPVGEGRSTGGRKPVMYGVRTDGLLAAGVHVDREQISAVVSDLSGNVQEEASVDFDFIAGERRFRTALCEVLDRVLAGRERHPMVGIGVGLPKMLRRSDAGVFRPLELADWKGINLPAVLGERYGLPVVVENRGQAIAVGEYLFGAGQGALDLLCLVLDRGLGGGVISGGRLFGGADGGAGVFGRMPADLSGVSGAPDRVSSVVDAAGIVRAAQDQLRAHRRRRLAGIPLREITVADVVDAALSGEAMMIEVLEVVGRCLGAVVGAALCITDSQVVVLCGSTLRAGDIVLGPFHEALAKSAPSTLPEIRLGQLGVRGGSLGAAALVLIESLDLAPAATPVGPMRH